MNQVPALGIIRTRLATVAPGFAISEAGYDSDTSRYRFRLVSNSEEVVISIRKELLDDLTDNRSSPNSTYSQYLIAKLDQVLYAGL